MVAWWFLVLIEMLIITACLLLIPSEVVQAFGASRRWLNLLSEQPSLAIHTLWNAFGDSWTAIGIVTTLLYAGALAPDMFGFTLARMFFILGNAILFLKLCFEEQLHGPKGSRKQTGVRATIITVLALFFLGISFFECGSVANKERGQPATVNNIWEASLFWKHPSTAISSPTRAAITSPTPEVPPIQSALPKESGSSEMPTSGKSDRLYAVSVGAALQSTGLIWGIYNAPPSGALAPVNLILAMSITNLQNKKTMLKRVSLEMKTPHGWMLLRRLPNSGFTWVAAFQNEFTHAQKLRIEPEDIIIPLTDRNLDAGETITGLGMFEYEDRSYVVKSGERSRYRVTIIDFAGNKDVVETSTQEDLQTSEDKYSMIGGSVSIANTGESTDVSSLPVRWFLLPPRGSTPTGPPSSLLIRGYDVPAIDMLETKVRVAIHLYNEGPDPMKVAFNVSMRLIERCIGIECVHDECGKLWDEFKISPEWNRDFLNADLPIHTPVREELSQGFYLTDADAKLFEGNDKGTLLFVMGVINITDKSGVHPKEFSVWMSGDRQVSLCPNHNN